MLRLPSTTLRTRLIVLVGLAVLPAAAGIVYGGYEQRRQAIAEVEREALSLAAMAASAEAGLVVEARQLLAVLGNVPAVRSGGREECEAFLSEVMREGSRYANLGVARPDGIIRCSVLPFVGTLDISHRQYFQRAMRTGDFAVGQYQIGLITGIPSINFGYPIVDAAGEEQGVVYAALALTWLQDRLSDAELPTGAEVLVVDEEGTVLARFANNEHPDDRNRWAGTSLVGTPLADAVLGAEDESVARLSGLDGIDRLYATTRLNEIPEEGSAMVSVGIPLEAAFAPVMIATARNLSLLALALILALVATWWSSGVLVLKPVQKLLLATNRLRDGDLGSRAEIRGAPREIEGLATGFNQMAASLQSHVADVRKHVTQIERLSRVRAVLSEINSAILRIRDRDELLRDVCRISVTEGEFELAWVAVPDASTGEPQVAAHAARPPYDADDTLAEVLRSDSAITGAALRDDREVISNDLEADLTADDPAGIRRLGFHAAAALPLRVGDRVVAVLTLYTREAEFFTKEEVRLLRELAGDVSLGLEYIEKEHQLHYLANYDPLTELPNRALFADRLGQAIARARQEERLAAVLLVGIERLSEINAVLGHSAGDLVLQTVAGTLAGAAGEGNTASRLGSKDFGIVLTNLKGSREVTAFTTRLLQRLPRELSHGSERINLSYRVGVSVFPHDGDEPDSLIKAATLALEVAGTSKGHPVKFYSAELDSEVHQRRRMEEGLRGAVAGNELRLLYQPVIDLTTLDPIGIEALVRWNSPELGEVTPDTFIPVAEEIGAIREIGEWVLDRAARQGKRLHDEGLRDLRMNVNVSVSQLRDPAYVEHFTGIIRMAGLDLASMGLGIEVTESELMENVRATVNSLESFKEMGLWIYIDDFGTGYSSLSYLRTLPLDSLKIDKSFIHDIPADRDAVAVVRGIIALARSIGLRVIAEGVETEEQLAALQEYGCDAGQGYLFSEPVDAEGLEAFLMAKASR